MAAAFYQILALDVDGTLLDPDGTLRPRTALAVRRAAQAGIRPVLCTGRRYRRARPIAAQLGLDTPIVCNSGAIIKNPGDHATLWRADFDQALEEAVLAIFHRECQPAVVFADLPPEQHDMIVPAYPSGRALFDEYVGRNRAHAEVDAVWRWKGNAYTASAPAGRGQPIFHICAIGSRPEMLAFDRVVVSSLRGQVQTFVQRSPRYEGTMCEILRHDASKWAAILHLAKTWGVDPDQICAVGDDVNDIAMIRHAGLGVAMGHASADVLNAADLITGDHEQDGVAMLVEDVLLA